MKKFLETVLKIWRDPVWSKIISAGIILLLSIVWAKYSNYTVEQVYKWFIGLISFRIPIYFILSVVAIIICISYIVKIVKRKPDPIWDEVIGNYTFRELYSILQNQNLPVGTVGMSYSGKKAPQDDLLTLFLGYLPFLNRGIKLSDNIDDGGYLYGVLAPKLVSYGLVTKGMDEPTFEGAESYATYETSELGHKFFSSFEKIHSKLNKKSKVNKQ